MAAGVDIHDGRVIPPEVAERDHALRSKLAESAELYARAVLAEDWRAFGFASVEAWRDDVLGSARLAAEVCTRIVVQLAEAGRTVREIAAATGTPRSTVARRTRNRVPNGTPATITAGQRAARQREERKRETAPPLTPAPMTPAGPAVAAPRFVPPIGPMPAVSASVHDTAVVQAAPPDGYAAHLEATLRERDAELATLKAEMLARPAVRDHDEAHLLHLLEASEDEARRLRARVAVLSGQKPGPGASPCEACHGTGVVWEAA